MAVGIGPLLENDETDAGFSYWKRK